MGWLEEPAGSIGLVLLPLLPLLCLRVALWWLVLVWWMVVVWLLLVSAVETAWTPVLFPFSFAFSTFVWTGLSTLFLGGWVCQDVCQLDCVLDHILAGLFESHSSSHLHSNLPGERVPSCLDLLEAIVLCPGQGLKSLDIIVDVDFFS